MRKIIKVLLISFSLLFISSCGTTDELENFSKAFKDYNYSKTTGYLYTSKQSFNNIVVTEKRIEQIIDRKPVLKAKTDFYERRLKEFDENNQFTETSYTTYYHKDSVGKGEVDNLTWENLSFKDYNDMNIPKLVFKKEYFSDYTLTKLADYVLLKGDIKDEYIKDFFNTEIEMTNISIEARVRGKTLYQFKIKYQQEKSLIETSYTIYYDKFEVETNK